MAEHSGPERDSYDYVICGGGTAGCALAARLVEDANLSVLLIEAGQMNDKVPASSVPAGTTQILGTGADWNIKSVPCPQLEDRQIDLHRGKFLGGSSGCNGTLCIRGTRQDFDDWEMDGWSGDEVFKYMSKAETFHSTSWFEANKTVHGSEGPLHVTPHEPCGISNLVLEAYQEKGFPIIHDVFTTGESPHACGHALRSIHKGTRSTAADYITSGNLKGQLSIVTNAYVEKMVLEEGPNGKRVAAVRLRDLSGKFTVIDVLKEAILSGGAYGSPAILIRSGIGPKAEVQKLGLECQIDCPGVGKNLMDHPVSSQYWNKPCLLLRLMVFSADGAQLVMVFYEVADPTLTTDHLVWHEGAKNKSLAQYEENKTGFLSKFPFGTFAFARLDDRLSNAELWHQASEQITVAGRDPMGLTGRQPHVEMWNTECYGPKVYGEEPGNDKQAFGMITTLFGARSRGEVTLNSLDPSANPVVDHKHFSDPLDLLVLAEGCRLANEIVIEGNATKDVIKGSWPERLTHHTYKERAEWEDYLKKNAGTCYHPSGTCKMGKVEDKTAVTDAELRVREVENLRIVDASIIPNLMGGHPQMTVYAIAEKAADMIKGSMKATA